MSYDGIEVEMFGSKRNMSQSYYRHHMRHVPTKIQVGPDLWVRTHANPGLHVRGRYETVSMLVLTSLPHGPTDRNTEIQKITLV